MKIDRAVLIEPEFPWFNLFSYAKIPLLGLPVLGTILKRMGIEVRIFCENLGTIDWQEIKKADVIGITALTSLAPRAYELARKIKSINSRCKIIMGGPHVTFRPEEALEQGADFVVRHEGETTLQKLIRFLKEENDPEKIRGLSFRKNDEIVHTPDRENTVDMDSLPTPDFSLIKNYEDINYIPVQTSRGCPHNCEFCSVVQMYGRKVRYREADKVIEDLQKTGKIFNLRRKHIFFVDDNFSVNKKRTITLLENMKRANLNLDWSTQEEVNVYQKEEILNLMKETGCSRLYLGLESFDDSVLEEYNKPQRVEDIKKAIKTIHDRNILIHGMFVLGGDNNSENSIRETYRSAVDYKIDTAQFFLLGPLPGTRLFRKLKEEGRLLVNSVKDWALFDGHHVLFKPRFLSPQRLQQLQIEAFKHFYNLKNSFRWLIKGYFKNFVTTAYGSFAIRKWVYDKQEYLQQLRS